MTVDNWCVTVGVVTDKMFSQRDLPEENIQISKTVINNRRRRRKRKTAQKNKQLGNKRDFQNLKRIHFGLTMSSWAENFTTAATWQLKHQIAYWKSKAKALEYENKLLHDIIKKNYTSDLPIQEQKVKKEQSLKHESNIDDEEICEENNEIEVSEEFIQFLKDNAKFKEDARLEREKLKTKLDSENPQDANMSEPSNKAESSEEKLKALYGKDWQRMCALEMSLECEFLDSCERDKPMHWPNIPFNFNFS